jgi:hypothetical protein
MPRRESTPFFSGCLRERSGGNIAPACERACIEYLGETNRATAARIARSCNRISRVGPASPTNGPQCELLGVYPEFAVHDLKPKPSQKVCPLAIRQGHDTRDHVPGSCRAAVIDEGVVGRERKPPGATSEHVGLGELAGILRSAPVYYQCRRAGREHPMHNPSRQEDKCVLIFPSVTSSAPAQASSIGVTSPDEKINCRSKSANKVNSPLIGSTIAPDAAAPASADVLFRRTGASAGPAGVTSASGPQAERNTRLTATRIWFRDCMAMIPLNASRRSRPT